jgi:PTH1 family peptidyl-tRNA hydrolase
MTDATAKPLIIPRLIVGLGNPEAKYNQTRHNIGFEVVDALAHSWQFKLQENRRFQGFFAEGEVLGHKIGLLKPTTYMNRSGQSVRAVMDWYKLAPESLLVVYDDMDLELGRLRLRLSGSAGGHNGMKSIISHLNSQDFPRLRLGIGRSKGGGETISHVLGKFSAEDGPIVEKSLDLAIESLELGLKSGIEKAMSLYNGRTVIT